MLHNEWNVADLWLAYTKIAIGWEFLQVAAKDIGNY